MINALLSFLLVSLSFPLIVLIKINVAKIEPSSSKRELQALILFSALVASLAPAVYNDKSS